MKNLSLRKKFLAYLIIFALVTIIGISLFVCQSYYHSEKNTASRTAFSYARIAAHIIDGDKIKGYVETGEKDEYYNRIQRFMNLVQQESDIKYYYVFIPHDDDLVYVWDANNYEGACDLGQHEDYMTGGKEAVKEVWCQDPPENIKMTQTKQYGYIASAFSPVYDSNDKPVAIVGVDLSMTGFYRKLFSFIGKIVMIIASFTLAAMAVLYLIMERKLVSPIRTLTKSVDEIINNLQQEKALEIDIKTGDEIETLANAFCKMGWDLRDYIAEVEYMTADRERIVAELNVAKDIQSSMLPSIFPAFPERNDFTIYAVMDAAKAVGGDFYDFFMVDDDHLAMVMADVSGKGIPAALFMVIAKTLIKNSAKPGVGPGEVLRKVNEQLCEGNDNMMFVTVWLGILELSTGRGISANAGHEHPAIRKSGGLYKLDVYKHSPAVAVMEGMTFKEHEFTLEPGDSLFVYTDGVPEATNAGNELFGTDRMVDVLNSDPGAEPEQVLANIKAAVDEFVGDAAQFDDLTMLSFKYNGEPKTEA